MAKQNNKKPRPARIHAVGIMKGIAYDINHALYETKMRGEELKKFINGVKVRINRIKEKSWCKVNYND